MTWLIASAALASAVRIACSEKDGAGAPGPMLAATPPMGYNTWNDLMTNPTEDALKNIAHRLKHLGFLRLGYQYITVDDCWMAQSRDGSGNLVGNPVGFPSGMKALADHIHTLGFKFGIYTDRGTKTCAGFPASLGHEAVDAHMFAQWGVDFVKNDGCADPDCGEKVCDLSMRELTVDKYTKMFVALNETRRPILHSICGWQPWFAAVGHRFGQMWRISADVKDWRGVYEASRIMEQLTQFHGPNSWNDPDMLLGSSSGAALALTNRQARSQFSLWVVMAAPLMIGASVLRMSDYDIGTYSNVDAIRINQDPLGHPGQVVYSNCPEYPRFRLKHGSLQFQVDMPASSSSTSFECGGDRIASCELCPGDAYCNGDCTWNYTQNGCVPAEGRQPNPGPVSCGQHSADNCHSCLRGFEADWCRGDCSWDASRQKCSPVKIEDRPGAWSVHPGEDQHQCQQVWAKRLQNDEVAVAAVNFGSLDADVQVPLEHFRLPWKEAAARGRDMWRRRAEFDVSLTLRLHLKASGGHELLVLKSPAAEWSWQPDLSVPAPPLEPGELSAYPSVPLLSVLSLLALCGLLMFLARRRLGFFGSLQPRALVLMSRAVGGKRMG